MYRMGVAVAVFAIANCSAAAQTPRVEITSPASGATVVINQTVKGKVSDPRAKVWLIIHPTATPDCWVQPMGEVEESGEWFVDATFGLPQSKGAQFSIQAIVNPKTALPVGQKLTCWPEGQAKSATVRDLIRQ